MIDIVVPTFNRPEKLERCLKSILNQQGIDYNVYIVVNGRDVETLRVINKFPIKFFPIVPAKNLYVIGAWNHYFKYWFPSRYQEGLVQSVAWVVDDVELDPHCLRLARQRLYDTFPTGDGVAGMAQNCPGRPEYTFKWYGQVLIGAEFVNRYKEVDYRVCCPFYTHFYQDEEMYQFASSLDRFIKVPEAVLSHYHPGFIKEEMDETHKMVRGKIAVEDKKIFQDRQKRNLIWGQSWTK